MKKWTVLLVISSLLAATGMAPPASASATLLISNMHGAAELEAVALR